MQCIDRARFVFAKSLFAKIATKQKSRPEGGFETLKQQNRLFDFGFLEFNMLFCNWVVLTLDHFFSHGAAVFLGYIKEPCVRSAFKLDLDRGGFCHGLVLYRLGK